MASASATSTRALSMEFKALQKEPVEGFLVTIPDDSDFYTWQVAIFGPPDTPYAGGYFKVSCPSMCVYVSVCVCVYVSGVCVCTCTYMCMCVCVCVYVRVWWGD